MSFVPNWQLGRPPLVKDFKGQKLVEHRAKTAAEKAHEQREMQAALKRDERKCRVPRCEYTPRKLPIDPCHLQHRGMGGDPSGERTTRATVISLCRVHHGLYDKGIEFDIKPHTAQQFDGPCDFLRVVDGKWEVFASEKTIGVSVAVGL
jgi:hypothetical protein